MESDSQNECPAAERCWPWVELKRDARDGYVT